MRRTAIGRAKLVVILLVVGSAVFGLFLGYLAYVNDSFPVAQRPFGAYASVLSSVFNGTEVNYKIQWLSPGYVPEYAQITSPNSDEANSPVCSIGVSSAASGETFELPFSTTSPTTALSSVTLSIAVQSSNKSASFTIQYTLDTMNAVPGDIQPSTYACYESAGADM
ncbi:MAG TPA: hypothetical protein VEJ36_02760 [Nitrososphaerales archaeon]|nr:hypothetical protein [Nitrososphaerales archaeon]